MKYCSGCGKELKNEAVICPHCGCIVSPTLAGRIMRDDRVSFGLCLLSFLLPLFGIIYWPVRYPDTPRTAAACGITALLSLFLNIIIFSFSATCSSAF